MIEHIKNPKQGKDDEASSFIIRGLDYKDDITRGRAATTLTVTHEIQKKCFILQEHNYDFP